MKNLFFLFFLTLSFTSFAQTQEAPNHCKVASEKVKEAANNFGNGNYGSAAENLGEAAAAATLCIREEND